MDLRRRFIFRGNAAAIGGRIVRPVDLMLETNTGSSLTVCGGCSSSRAGATRYGDWVSFSSAETSAEGVFDDVKRQIDFTNHLVAEDELTTSTKVSAEVTELSVGRSPNLKVKRVRAELRSTSPAGSGETPIALGNDTMIEGVSIDDYGLIIELAVPLFQRHDTLSKLLTAADDPRFVKESGDCLFMTSPLGGAPAPSAGRMRRSSGTTYATIVKSIKWAGQPFPGATIDHHSVTVPEFGTIFFGELLMTDKERRLSMLRLELGSETGGTVAAAEVDSNGTWSN